MRNKEGDVLPCSAAEPMRVVRWQGFGSLGFKGGSIIVGDGCDDNVDNVAQVTAGTEVSGVVEDEEDWNVGDISLSRNAEVSMSVHVEFQAIQP